MDKPLMRLCNGGRLRQGEEDVTPLSEMNSWLSLVAVEYGAGWYRWTEDRASAQGQRKEER